VTTRLFAKSVLTSALDALFDRAFTWCLACLPVEPVRLGSEQRTVYAIDSSTIARLRAHKQRSALLGKGYCHRARWTVQANLGKRHFCR
jgi:hypothetical protein